MSATSERRSILAWGVHAFTASGAVVGALALLSVARGELSQAALLMILTLLIDAVDGALARAVGVAEALPYFDGRRLDDMVDFLNYVIVAVVFMVGAGILPHWGWAAIPILASAYGFSQTDAKTPDDFFLGFPSYWNAMAIYLWWLQIPPALSTLTVIAFSALVFVPLKYVYPSRLRVLPVTTAALAAVCAALVVTAILAPELGRRLRLVEISLFFPVYYFALSLKLGGWHRRARA